MTADPPTDPFSTGANATHVAAVPTNERNVLANDLLPGDTYQEGPYVVFTAQYHLRRGYCCNSGCRHCPYR